MAARNVFLPTDIVNALRGKLLIASGGECFLEWARIEQVRFRGLNM